MPLDPSDFPYEVQVAFFIFGFLEDNWDGMSGAYMGKIWSNLEYLINLYDVSEPKTVLYIMKLYESALIEYKGDKADKKRKAEERKSAGGGKQFTHSVKANGKK
jgi:hypothetical protein